MLAALLALTQPSPMLVDLERMAVAKDAAGVRGYYGPAVQKLPLDPMAVLKTGGAYGTGKFGWHARELSEPGSKKKFVVFTTPLTVEDIGERLFEQKDDRLIRYVNELDSGGWSIRRHNFHISFKPANKQAFLTDRMILDHSGKTPGELFLRLSPAYQVSMITDDETHQKVPFNQAGGIVALGSGVGPTRKLTVTYAAKVNLPNYGGSISNRYAMLTDEYWYPIIARQPAPYDATVDVPRGWTVVAQGEVTSHLKTTGGETWSYRMDLPVTFMSIAAGKYHTYEQAVGGRMFRTWSFRMTPEESRWQGELYAPIMKVYERFAPYPFSGYGALDQPNYGDGMLEAYSFNTGQQGSYPNDEAHEPSHTWFGGMLNNTYLRSFWNESFAVFCDNYYRRNVPIGNSEERHAAFVDIPNVSPAFNVAPLDNAPADIGPAASALGYGKGGYVLQMLEDEMGSSEMTQAMKRWLASQPHGSLGEWEGFEKIVGPDYKWFFDEWVHRPGYPVFSMDEVAYKDGGVSGHIVFSGPAYRVSMDALLVFKDGSHTVERFSTTQMPSGDGFRFKIPTSKTPIFVSFDPFLKILRPISQDERPFTAAMAVAAMKHVRDTKRADYLSFLAATPAPTGAFNVVGTMLIGNPETMPILGVLCKQVGFNVTGNSLTYKGTTIDLRSGGAIAVVPLPNGNRCAIGLGNVHLAPNMGNAQVAVFDQYGRFLRGETAPKLSGNLTFRL